MEWEVEPPGWEDEAEYLESWWYEDYCSHQGPGWDQTVFEFEGEDGYWEGDKIYIYDCTEELPEEEADVIVDYLYQEGFIMDRRTKTTIVRGEL